MSRRIPRFQLPLLVSKLNLTPFPTSIERKVPSQNHSTTASSPPQHVLITGGSRGIGLSIAHAFARAGSNSIQITGRNSSTLQTAISSLQETYRTSNPSQPISEQSLALLIQGIQADVFDFKTWKSVFASDKKATTKGWPIPDILINSAGVTHSSLLMAMKEESIHELIDVNLKGTVFACQAVSKAMLRSKHGQSEAQTRKNLCIINISSLLATHGGRGSSVYSASKAGVLGLTRALAAELGPLGIRVNAIVPGYIETDMTQAMDPTARSNALEKIPLKRFGAVDEIAEAALFLAKNEYANNCVLNLDGGLSATM
ncbi:Short-chain dehydrogenase/reductase [Venturia nashicola]|uniref:Short-chain dehydrogenase/reductase n=1 Tax=Venturia nashicola TaxID=86259 RepID=A0A4Z1PAY2_9PEZI|nr:Short-chain dehydrogenase/reductase [Venturia nashicola]TLD34948.1 Short-chain dehydrogenase/reductase [Venturia nashicola]